MACCPVLPLFLVALHHLEKNTAMTSNLNLCHSLQRIDAELLTLSSVQSAIFSAACAERLLPNYAEFSRAVQWGAPFQVRVLLDYVWEVVAGKLLEQEVLGAAIKLCTELTPNTADFNYQFTAQALDATSCLFYALDSLLGNNGHNALESAQSARFSVEHYLMSQALFQGNEGDVEEIVYSSTYWIREINIQECVLNTLVSCDGADKKLIEDIRTQSWNNGVSNLGVTWLGKDIH